MVPLCIFTPYLIGYKREGASRHPPALLHTSSNYIIKKCLHYGLPTNRFKVRQRMKKNGRVSRRSHCNLTFTIYSIFFIRLMIGLRKMIAKSAAIAPMSHQNASILNDSHQERSFPPGKAAAPGLAPLLLWPQFGCYSQSFSEQAHLLAWTEGLFSSVWPSVPSGFTHASDVA